MKKIILILIIGLMWQFAGSQAIAQSDAGKAADCSTYARNRAESEASAGGGALSGAAGGAAKGAIFGVIVGDSSKAAKRGAALGGTLGAIGGASRKSQDREARYQYYYDACMRGEM